VYVLELRPRARYLRPFAAAGFLGSYTTLSTWMVDTDHLLGESRPTCS
jgi:CrcB protein